MLLKNLRRLFPNQLSSSREIIQFHEITIEITRKNIKTLRLSIVPGLGKVRLSIPFRTSDQAVLQVLSDRFDWIRQHLSVHHSLAAQHPLQYVDGDQIQWLGNRLKLIISTQTGAGSVTQDLGTGSLIMISKPGSTREAREILMYDWYRKQSEPFISDLLGHWAPIVGVEISGWKVRRMKSRWGSCNIATGRVCLNLELARFPLRCLEYVIVHELVHLLERGHNARFYGFMEHFLPDWKKRRQELNHANQG